MYDKYGIEMWRAIIYSIMAALLPITFCYVDDSSQQQYNKKHRSTQ